MEKNNLFNPSIYLGECQFCDSSGIIKDENNEVIYEDGVVKRCKCYFQNKLLQANIGMDYWSINANNFSGNRQDLEKVSKYFNAIHKLKSEGRGFYLYSPGFGSGKTTLAVMLLKQVLFTTNYTALFIPFSDLVILNTRYMLASYDKIVNEKIEAIRNADFLVIDDLGKEYDNQRDNGRATLNSILRFRDMWHKPTIYTANIPLDENFAKLYGGSNHSIIFGRSMFIQMENERDLRRTRIIKEIKNDNKTI